MKIKLAPNYALNCDVCIQGKMSNDRNETLNCKATKILALVHSNLAGLHLCSECPQSKIHYSIVGR